MAATDLAPSTRRHTNLDEHRIAAVRKSINKINEEHFSKMMTIISENQKQMSKLFEQCLAVVNDGAGDAHSHEDPRFSVPEHSDNTDPDDDFNCGDTDLLSGLEFGEDANGLNTDIDETDVVILKEAVESAERKNRKTPVSAPELFDECSKEEYRVKTPVLTLCSTNTMTSSVDRSKKVLIVYIIQPSSEILFEITKFDSSHDWGGIGQAASELMPTNIEPILEQYRPMIVLSMKFCKLTLGIVVPHSTGVSIIEYGYDVIESRNTEVLSNHEFRELLDSYFSRLPSSYALDINLDRVEVVLLHQKLLTLAKDPDSRPVFHVRFVEAFGTKGDVNDEEQVTSDLATTMRHSSDTDTNRGIFLSQDRNDEIDFEPCSKLEDLILDVRRNSAGKEMEMQWDGNPSGMEILA